MQSKDLQLSAKFANYLSKVGLLEPLVNALKIYREKENYIYELESKRIIRQSLAKPYADILGKLSFGGDLEKTKKEFSQLKEILLEAIEKDAGRIYGEKPKTVGEEITMEMLKKAKANQEKKKMKEKVEEPDEKLFPKE